MEKQEKNSLQEAHSSKKTKWVILGVGLFLAFLVGLFLFQESPETQIQEQAIPLNTIDPITGQSLERNISLKNPRYANGDLDAIFDDEIENNVLRFDLKSHPEVNYIKQVGAGNQVVMYYDVNSIYQLENALGTPQFVDMKTGQRVQREWKYVYWGNESYESPVYSCSDTTSSNGTITQNCIQRGTKTETRETWLPYNSRNLTGRQRIGIEVEVKLNDHLDGVWVVGGKRIDRHAQWTASLESGLQSWYKLNESSGQIFDYHSNKHATQIRGTLTYGQNSVSDITTPSINFTGNADANFSTTPFNQTQTYSVWINPTLQASDRIVLGRGIGSIADIISYDNGYVRFISGNQSGSQVRWNATTTKINANSGWHHILVQTFGTATATSTLIWIDNVAQTTDFSSVGTGKARPSFEASFYLSSGLISGFNTNFTGGIDEPAFWDRNLTSEERSILWNDGIGCTYQSCGGGLTINLLSPTNYQNFTTNEITFNWSVITLDPSLSIVNTSLLINGVINETNTSGFNGTYSFPLTLADGNHNWTVIAFGNDSVQYNATNGTLYFGIDTIAPQVLVTYPNETITFHELNTNLSLNWSVNDTHLSTCWFDWNGANTTVTCVDNSTTFNITNGTAKSLTFYANDTFGNQNSSTVTWNYRLFLNSETYDAIVTEGQSTTFSANLLTNGSAITTATLTYNGTGNSGTINNHGSNNYTVTKTITVPSVTTETNITFNWTINQSAMSYTLDSNNQTITDLRIDNCAINSITLYNFTIYDEEVPTKMLNATGNNTRADLNLIIRTFGTTTQLVNFSNQYNQVNPFRVCLNSTFPSTANFNIDVQVQYRATDFSEEFYNIQNATINNSVMPINISLYDLNSSQAQIFKIIFRDSSFLPIKDALVEVHRKYVDEGIFRIVEIPKTDSRGEAVANLVLNNVIYNFKIIKFGVTLATFDDVIAVCQIPLVQECQIDLNAFSDSITLPDFETAEDFSFTLGYDNDTRIVSSIFTIPSGTTSIVSLNVTMEDALGTSVCSDQLTSTSGTLSCVVPSSFGNSTIRAEIYKDASLQAQGSIKLNQNPIDIYGGIMIGLSIFLLLTLVGVGVSNSPIITVLFLMVGIILLFGLNLVANTGFIGATATILWIIVAILIILIKGVGRN